MTPDCQARHDSARGGHCLDRAGHEGTHWAFSRYGVGYKFVWPNASETPKPNVLLTQSELGILLTILNPVRQFFPELEKKLTDAREESAQ
jgi:hypothetical protein